MTGCYLETCFNGLKNDNILFLFPGVVSVKSMLDRETQDIYQLEVVATDRGTPPLSNSTRVSISVTDVNDNSPQFDKSTLIGEILENKPVASLVGKVVATDKDLGENARVTYSLNANDAFAIDRITGEVISTVNGY